MRTPVMAGNWKMNNDANQARTLARAIKTAITKPVECEVVVAPPFTALSTVADVVRDSPIKLAAQNVHWEPSGAFTGEISVSMIEALGCQMVILGHSERRQYFGETDHTVSLRLRAVLQSALEAIVCIGETLQQRDAGNHLEVIAGQLSGALDGLTPPALFRIMLAYEPVWAIGTGRTATPDVAQEVHCYIREWLSGRFGADIAQAIRILYGGSVKPDNVGALMAREDVDGALVGGASLTAESFCQLVYYND